MRFGERMFTRASAISVVSIFRTPLPNVNSLRPRWHHRRIRVYYSSIGLQSLVLVGSSTSCYRITHRKIRISVSARARLNAVSILLVCTLSHWRQAPWQLNVNCLRAVNRQLMCLLRHGGLGWRNPTAS